MESSNSKGGIGTLQLLPPEIRNSIFTNLNNPSLKSLRLTCSNLGRTVPLNIDRVFISANSLNIQVFRIVADNEKYRHKVTEIIWDDARLSEGPKEPEEPEMMEVDQVIPEGLEVPEDIDEVPEPLDPNEVVASNGCPRWFTQRSADNGVGINNFDPPDDSMGFAQSWDYYKALLEDQREILESNQDIQAFQYGLQRFPNLKRVTITPSTHGRIGQPMFETPMIRAFPPGFTYPLPRPWPYHGLDVFLLTDIPWASATPGHEEEISYWRGFRVVTRALVEYEKFHRVTELIIGGREIMTGVNCHVFDQRCKEYNDLARLLTRPGFSRLDLDLQTFEIERDGIGWKSYRTGLLREALAQAKDLRHLSLRTTTDTKDPFWWIAQLPTTGTIPDRTIPLRMVLPLEDWPNLQHFGISNMLVTTRDLISVLTDLPRSLRSVELSNLAFDGDCWRGLLNEMLAKLDWRTRPVGERPTVHIPIATLYRTFDFGLYVDLDNAVSSFLYEDGENPFPDPTGLHNSEAHLIPRGIVGTERDFFDPDFSAPYEFTDKSEL
ncbi:hypothetical protein FPOA_04786 [Fusarium poae]|uniref:F-box domain-containing protein n=1 Tax=Fusarium poae TaxID=36050 RepID=A0A1B8AUM4_FUSPO|nr:hypothetical protein FPOA_04786 [Fusarium poae]